MLVCYMYLSVEIIFFLKWTDDAGAVYVSKNLISLPAIGNWISVVVTAVTHPHLFWVQLPQGSRNMMDDYDSGNCTAICYTYAEW